MCRNAAIGCVACKKKLAETLNAILDPIRARRNYFENHIDEVKDIISAGTEKANKIGNENLLAIKEKMHVKL